MQIALDTSFLMTAIEFKIDVFTELSGWRLFVPAAVKAELQKLATGRGGAATAARLALPIANKAAPLPVSERRTKCSWDWQKSAIL